MTPSGIEAATFRFVAQHLNHCTTAVPSYIYIYIYMSSPCWELNHSSSAVKTVRYSRTESHKMEGNVSKVLRQSYILHHELQSRYEINTFFHKATRSFLSVRSRRNTKTPRYKETIIQTRSTAHFARQSNEPVAPASCVLQLTASKVPKH